MQNGDDVLISGFGKFTVREKRGRSGINPQTGKQMELPPRRVVTFKCSGVLRAAMNGAGGPMHGARLDALFRLKI
ncbi:MAG: HU family DNA-binding protein [Syntrophobacteraceae bacterium]